MSHGVRVDRSVYVSPRPQSELIVPASDRVPAGERHRSRVCALARLGLVDITPRDEDT
jgi:hypothetical protein